MNIRELETAVEELVELAAGLPEGGARKHKPGSGGPDDAGCFGNN